MSEAGGPTTQAGIFYQNTIAALYLGRMLDLRPRSNRDRVIAVRLEAPEAIDDIVVRMGDGSTRFIQAKRTLALGTDVWTRLWANFDQQLENAGVDDRLSLVLGESTELARNLRECAERAVASIDDSEYLQRLTAGMRTAARSVVDSLSLGHDGMSTVRKLFSQMVVEIIPDNTVDRDYAPLWMPVASVPPDALLRILRDYVGGESRIRNSFNAAILSIRLREDHEVEILEPHGWGAPHYRAIIAGRSVLEVPGTDLVKPLSSAFLWPKATRYDRTRRADFDDETVHWAIGVRSDQVDLSLFPHPGLDRIVVVAGPGMGKSVLTRVLASRSVQRGLLPVVIPVPELSRCDIGIGEYLEQRVNTIYEVSIDWVLAAEAGLLVLFLDGLDEVGSAQRATILERVKTFTLRYPSIAWLITVRDAAALAAPTAALVVELEPLDDEEIGRFIDLYRPASPDLRSGLVKHLDARPDLKRLVRIPLFLALVLATLGNPDDLPSNRTALLEAYLDLLFRPAQFKPTEADGVAPRVLRSLTEDIAFRALEREEIEIGVRLFETTIADHLIAGEDSEQMLEGLIRRGVLRRVGPGRYIFPFPIVQEYLAACHLISDHLGELPDRLPLVVKRPWAQALQFALEQHPDPGTLVTKLLSSEDDAFHTNLRLIARCVTNGMAVAPDVADEITRRLAVVWPNSSWRIRMHIGALLSDMAKLPLVPELRKQLSKPWLLYQGAGAIVTRLADHRLTQEVLSELLDGNIDDLLNLSELQAAVDKIADWTLTRYAARARDSKTSPKEQESIAALIGHLDGHGVLADSRESVALDDRLPLGIRLAAFALGPTPIDPRALPLISTAVAVDAFIPLNPAMRAISKSADPEGTFSAILLRRDLSLVQRLRILDWIGRALPKELLPHAIHELGRQDTLEADLRSRLLVYAARYGSTSAMAELIAHIPELPVEIISGAISVFGHHRSRSLVERSADGLKCRSLQPSERVDLASSAVIGMTALFEMDSFRCGGLHAAPIHPGIDLLRDLLADWEAMTDYAPLDGLRISEELLLIGSEVAGERVRERIEQVVHDTSIDLEDVGNAALVGSCLRALRERHHAVPMELLELIIARSSYNGASNAIQIIGDFGTRAAFESLVGVFGNVRDRYLRDIVLDAVESLAGRLGLRVSLTGVQIVAVQI